MKMYKFTILIIICSAVFFALASKVDAATEFVSTINKTGQDYDNLIDWESAIDSDLTTSTTRVYKVASVTGTVVDGTRVQGDNNGYEADILHVNVSDVSECSNNCSWARIGLSDRGREALYSALSAEWLSFLSNLVQPA